MSVYRVEIDDDGCPQCQHDQTFHVIGPDEVASSTSYGDPEEAASLARELDRAYELGQQNAPPGSADPWTPFLPGSMPPEEGGVSILVWDAEFKIVSSMYYTAEGYTPEYLAQMKYTHWMRASALAGPRVPDTEQLAVIEPPPSTEPPTIQPPPVLEAPAPRAPDWDDDIPF